MTIKLKPCPNPECNCDEMTEYTHDKHGFGTFNCMNCGLRGPVAYGREEAARLWNALPREQTGEKE